MICTNVNIKSRVCKLLIISRTKRNQKLCSLCIEVDLLHQELKEPMKQPREHVISINGEIQACAKISNHQIRTKHPYKD